MKKILTTTGVGLILATGAFADVNGVWRSETNDQGASISVEIYPCGKETCGTVARIHNSDDMSALNKTMIKAMTSSDGVNFSGGMIYAPDQEKWYSAKMKLRGGNKMKVSGCVLGGVFCRSQTWTRE